MTKRKHAGIQPRGNAWRAEVCVNGHRDSATFNTLAEAKSWREHRTAELKLLNRPPQRSGEQAKLTLRELLEQQKDELDIRTRRSALAHDARVRKIVSIDVGQQSPRPIGDIVVKQLTDRDFINYKKTRLNDGVARSTVKRELNLLRAAFNRLIEAGAILHNPVRSAIKSLPKKDPEVGNLLGVSERERFIEQCEVNASNPRRNPWLSHAFAFSAATALRKAELLALEWTDVDFENAVLRVQRVDDLPDSKGKRTTRGTKNGEERETPLSVEALEILRSVPRAVDPALRHKVFPITYEALKSAFRRVREKAGTRHFRWHDLRHMAATDALARLGNIAHVAVVTGHRDWESLKRYTHPTAKDVAKLLGARLAERSSSTSQPS